MSEGKLIICPSCGHVTDERFVPAAEAERLERQRDVATEALQEIVDAFTDGRVVSTARLKRLVGQALHPAESLYACPTCGENVTRYGQRCPRCVRNIEEDRLERESGR